MTSKTALSPDYLFEVSWEVCNKVGGIHTVLSTKAPTLQKEWKDRLIFIGPDILKESEENHEFTEDTSLFTDWKKHVLEKSLKVRTGRWNIPGSPLVMLVDFSPHMLKKNEIFEDLWVKFRLDSLHGQWDYIEPALFGYGAGVVIASFYEYHLNSTDAIVAHFHEWLTGAGVLYLHEHAPQIATVFTTHATVIGRTIAGNGLPFYGRFDTFQADQIARDFHVVSKHSLEKAAANYADCFTCVSEVTARECRKFLEKSPVFITPNGFDHALVPDDKALFDAKRAAARKKILDVAGALSGRQLPEDSLLLIKSGRYEFRNKGLDVFIDSLSLLRKDERLNKQVVAVLFIPAHHTGPRKELLDRLNRQDGSAPEAGGILTHNLQGAPDDPILGRIRQNNLENSPGGNLQVIFAPVYLNGKDGVFDLPYYDLLIGFDLAVFPSYYEPWGYTPLESLAFQIPTITTRVSGFGMAAGRQPAGDPGTNAGINRLSDATGKSLYIIDRQDQDEKQAAAAIAGILLNYAGKPADEKTEIRKNAAETSKAFSWSLLINQYKTAYDFALQKSLQREHLFRSKPPAEPVSPELRKQIAEQLPAWRTTTVQFRLPETLSALQKICHNLWWSWSTSAIELLESISAGLWQQSNKNPSVMLQLLSQEIIQRLEKDPGFLSAMKEVKREFDQYMQAPLAKPEPLVAYFSMEYGLHPALKLYAGGLGMLAGDFLKEASDQGANMIGVGLFYKKGYFKQRFSGQGEQVAEPDIQELSHLPVSEVKDPAGNPVMIHLACPGCRVHAKVWKISVGRVPLYLLDTDIAENSEEDRLITFRLYEGDQQIRLKQEIVLGIGGIRMLDSLGVIPDIYHCNEGHAAFTGLERIYQLVRRENLRFEEAMETIRSSTLFTTHTSVPAAMDRFPEDLLRIHFSYMTEDLNISWGRFMELGKANPANKEEEFSMLYLSARLSQEINAVSNIHRTVSRRLLNVLWKDFQPDELHIGSVTNGVHVPTWVATAWQDYLEKIDQVSDSNVWQIKTMLKKKLTGYLREKLSSYSESRHEHFDKLTQLSEGLDEHALLIGFARRFVRYKRPDILFTDLQRLIRIVNNPERPVRIIFAGKAHPKDQEGLDLLKKILEITRTPGLQGKVLFLEDYDMEIAKVLIQGVDVWLNTPKREMEACGTSGMKAALNGALNLSTPDGWWAEVYQAGTGWALDKEKTYRKEHLQDQLDAETIYKILENEIIPLYFTRDHKGIPTEWVGRIKASMAHTFSSFTMKRVLAEYQQYYDKLYQRTVSMKAGHYAMATELADWKKKILAGWKSIRMVSVEPPENPHPEYTMGEELTTSMVIDTGLLSADEIGAELVVISSKTPEDRVLITELPVAHKHKNLVTYRGKFTFDQSGSYRYSFRIFPKNPLLPHRQDFGLITWC